MKRLLAALLALCGAAASADPVPCPQAWEVKQADMLGLWQVEFTGRWEGATLLLEKHPEYADSFRGALRRADELRSVAGDIDEGDVTLEESADGVHIAATWIGEVVEGSCGREIRGTWKADGASTGTQFTLRKQ